MNNKRILVILATPFYLNKGSSVTASSMIKALGNTNYKVDLITYPLGNNIKIKNVNIIRAKIPFYKKISAGPSLSKIYADFMLFFYTYLYLLKNKKNYFIIIGEDCEGGLISLILAKLFRKKSIYQMYNPFNQTLRPYTSNKIILKLFEFLDWIIEKGHKNITVEWDYEYERIKRKYPYGKNIKVVYDSFPKEAKKPDNFNLNKEYIAYAGNFKPYQGIPLFLDIFEKYIRKNTNLKLVLVGGGYEEVENIVKRKKLSKNVIFTGFLPPEETNYVLKNSLFCILPRIIDGPPGMKALHYFSQGKTILGTDLSCNSKLIKNGYNGLLVSESRLFEGIKKLVENVDLRLKFEKNIKKEKMGSPSKTNEQMEDFIGDLK